MAETFKRFERKFIITKNDQAEILKQLKDEIVQDSHAGPDGYYNVYSIYYDTKNSDIIRHDVDSPIYKEKLRIRSYKLNPSKNDLLFFERKKKFDGVGNKRRILLTFDEILQFTKGQLVKTFDDYESTEIYKEIDNYLKVTHAIPSTFIYSHRSAFFGKNDPAFRITFDDKVVYRNGKKLDFTSEEGKDLLNDDTVIMEVKFKDSLPLNFVKIMSTLKLYTHGFSKYGEVYKKELKQGRI